AVRGEFHRRGAAQIVGDHRLLKTTRRLRRCQPVLEPLERGPKTAARRWPRRWPRRAPRVRSIAPGVSMHDWAPLGARGTHARSSALCSGMKKTYDGLREFRSLRANYNTQMETKSGDGSLTAARHDETPLNSTSLPCPGRVSQELLESSSHRVRKRVLAEPHF